MSANKRTLLLHRSIDSEGNNRELDVYEEDTSKQLDVENANVTILCPNTYSYITFEYEYKTMSFLLADVYVTNRFTLDTVKETVSFDHAIETGDAAIYGLVNTSLAEPTSYIRVFVDASRKRSIIEVVLSMADFMFGDIYVQFYNDNNEEGKNKYCAPIIVQFTNAPTIYVADIYKLRPNTETILSDTDSVFASSFGSVSAGVPDTGRTDVLTGDVNTNSEYYNDFMNTHRLITNGLPENNHSVSSHPIYVVEYRSFVPSAFSNEFCKRTITNAREKRNSVGFTFANTSAYLTSAVSVTANDIDEMFKTDGYIAMSCKAVEEHPDFNLPVTNSYSAVGHYKKFNVYLTASDVDDKWLREHTRVCADFALTGLDPYWTGESDELPILTTDRLYYVFNNVSYTPNVFELSWFAAGKGTSYYLVKKCPTGQDRTTWINDTANWIQVFTKENRPEYLLSDKTICADNKTVMCKENDPVSVQSHNGVKYITDPSECICDNIEDIELDRNGHPLVVYENYFTYGVLHGGRWFSDDSTVIGYTARAWFKIMNETTDGNLHAVVYRVSDNSSYDSEFELNAADAEFVIIYRA